MSVVIPTHNGGPMLVDCVRHLKATEGSLELILVDNASDDESIARTVDLVPTARVVRNDVNQGFAGACNQGAAIANGEFVLFLNNDALFDGDNLGRLLTAAASDHDGAIWQPINLRPDGSIEFAGDLFTWSGFFLHLDGLPSTTSVFSTKAACLLVRRSALEALGGFREDYFAYFEESDLCWRARMAGWEVRVVPESTVVHLGGVTTSRILTPAEARYLSFRNRLRTIVANASAASLCRILPLHLLGCLGFLALFVVTGRLRSVASIVAAVAWPFRNPALMRSQRASSQRGRTLADRDVLRLELVAPLRPRIIFRHLREQIYRWEALRPGSPYVAEPPEPTG